MKMKSFKGIKISSILVSALILIIAIFLLIPFIWMISISLRAPAEAYRLPPSIFPDSFKFTSYIELFKSNINVVALFKNSIITTVVIVLAQVINCPMAGYAFARLKFKGRKPLFYLLLVSLMIPIQVIIIPLYIVISKLHMLNNLLSVILPCCFSAFGVFLFRQSFMDIPKDFEHSARIDGAGYFWTYLSIMLPQVKTTIIALVIISFNFGWNLYFTPLIFLTKLDKMTLPIGLAFLKGYMSSGNVSVIMASVSLAVIPIMLIFFYAQKYIVEGLTSSGIKG
ncbi:MAG: carbohydrate ABC transporter permease [Clostridiaceae bacterium]|nr:carbohydrate ABC transporter permease [Clostridiaceae bacterium]